MDEKLQKAVVSGRSSSDNRRPDLGLSSPCERAEASLPSVGLRDEVGKHEPGPWKVSLVDGYLMVHAPDHESDKYIAEVANEADALLIAAAPELLEVAKRLLGLAHDLHFTGSLIDLAEAAIAKAEGR